MNNTITLGSDSTIWAKIVLCAALYFLISLEVPSRWSILQSHGMLSKCILEKNWQMVRSLTYFPQLLGCYTSAEDAQGEGVWGGMKVGLKAVIIGQSPLLAMLIERAVWLSRYRLSHSHLHRSKALITRVCHGCWGLSVHLYPDMTAESSPGWSVDGLIGLQRTTSTERKIRQKMVSKAGVRVFRVDRRMEMWQCFGNARGDKKSNIIQRQNVIFTLSWTF